MITLEVLAFCSLFDDFSDSNAINQWRISKGMAIHIIVNDQSFLVYYSRRISAPLTLT